MTRVDDMRRLAPQCRQTPPRRVWPAVAIVAFVLLLLVLAILGMAVLP